LVTNKYNKFSISTFSLSTDEHEQQEIINIIYSDLGEIRVNQPNELLPIKVKDVFMLPGSPSPNILPEKPDDSPQSLSIIRGAYKKPSIWFEYPPRL
jgi:hypothetical protein